MANIVFPNNQGIFIGPFQSIPSSGMSGAASATVLNATGESTALVGRVMLEAGSGSKTISSAGGAIYVAFETLTFVDAGTTLRIGIQDLAATGLEDTTFDVSADLVGGTDTIGANQVNTIPMESGTKTINHGDEVAIVIEMVSRAGTDTVGVYLQGSAPATYYPYVTVDSGSGPAKQTSIRVQAAIKFNDGTHGFIEGVVPGFLGLATFANNSTPDEYALIFTSPATIVADCFLVALGGVATTDTFALCVYSDPLVTPSEMLAVVFNPNKLGSTSTTTGFVQVRGSNVTFLKDATYGISIKPTSTGSVILNRWLFNTGNSELRKSTLLGTNWQQGTRSDETGAFTPSDIILPMIGFYVKEIEVPSGGLSLFS